HSLEFVDAAPIAAALRTELRPGDGVITPWWTADPLRYYLQRDSADIVPLNVPPWDSTDTPHLSPATPQRLIVISPRVGQSAADSRLRVLAVDPTSFSPPAGELRFSSTAVYFVTRASR